MPARPALAPLLLAALLPLWTAGCGSDAPTVRSYESYDTGIDGAAAALAAALRGHPDVKVTVPPLRRKDGIVPELGGMMAHDLEVAMKRTDHPVTLCNYDGIEALVAGIELQRKRMIEPADTLELGRLCGGDVVLWGILHPEAGGVEVRLSLITLETAEMLGGSTFWVPLSEEKRQALQREAEEGGAAPREQDDNLPQTQRVGDFELKLTSCKFVEDRGLFCHLTIRNQDVIERELRIFHPSPLTDNQEDIYDLQEVIRDGVATATGDTAGKAPVFAMRVPPHGRLDLTLRYTRIQRREQVAALLQVDTADGAARFEDFRFDRD